MKKYRILEEAGGLEVNLSGGLLDVCSIGVLYLNLQDIFDKVAFRMLSEAGLVEPTWKRPRHLPTRQYHAPHHYIRAEIDYAKVGSWETVIVFSVATVLSDPHVIAILQNLAANIIWAVGASGVNGLRRKNSIPPDSFVWRQRNDPIEIGPNLRDVILALAENNSSQERVLSFKHTRTNRESLEVSISISGDTPYNA